MTATANNRGKIKLRGCLSGTCDSPDVVAFKESGGQVLPVGSVSDGQFLKRQGNSLVGAAASGGAAWGSVTGTLSNQTDLQTALDGKSSTSHNHDVTYAPIAKGVTNGDSHDHNGGDGAQIAHGNLSGIGTNTHAQIDTHLAASAPHAGHELTSNKGAASGYASLDGSTKVPIAQVPTGSAASTVCIGNDSRLSDSRAPTQHSINGAAHSFPGGTTTYLRADGTFTSVTASVAAPFTGNQAPGSFTVADGQFGLHGKRLTLATTERATVEGSARLIISG